MGQCVSYLIRPCYRTETVFCDRHYTLRGGEIRHSSKATKETKVTQGGKIL